MIVEFLRDERAQDVTEYALLVAAVALGSTALFLGAGGSVGNIWASGGDTLSNAAVASSGTTPGDPSNPGNGNGNGGGNGNGNEGHHHNGGGHHGDGNGGGSWNGGQGWNNGGGGHWGNGNH